MPGTKGEDGHQRIIAHITEWMIDESTQWAWSNDLPACRECRGRCGASPPANSGRAKAAFITGRRREAQAGSARVYLQAYRPGIIGHSRYGRSPLPAVTHRLQPRPAPPRTPRKLNNEHVGITPRSDGFLQLHQWHPIAGLRRCCAHPLDTIPVHTKR